MPNALFSVPKAVNETVLSYAPGSPERGRLLKTYEKMLGEEVDIPMFIGGREVRSGSLRECRPPHDHQRVIGRYHWGGKEHVEQAIEAALAAHASWSSMPWFERAGIFLRAADLVSGPYRDKINAATMLAQSKTVHQAEIDAACEFADFLRFNVQFMIEIYAQQPESSPGIWNRMEYRALEGFILAVTPFNFTAIAGNLPSAPALMGNVALWKPADTQIYSAWVIMEIFRKAGLPDGVINLVYTDGALVGDLVFKHPDFAGLHFTGSTSVFKHLWKEVGANIDRYKAYPRIVGETGGKDFILAHPSADAAEVATSMSRGAFEFQGQKCSAASRAYVPASIWPQVKQHLVDDVKSFKMGSPGDPSNFITAVIDERSFDKIVSFIDYAKSQKDAELLIGGGHDKSKGYFIEATVVATTNPNFRTMCEEIFGPFLTIFVYEDAQWSETLDLINRTSEYALTGSVFSRDRYAVDEATRRLAFAAGNFYVNDKPTGAVVGQQPFGGARGSGTNDKAGSILNLLRWVSPRTIKETLVPPSNYRYPFLG
ncbi:MAG: L-glutamate gamma-semialdehyde dehydrogenase [Flavobacteriaceae bacterium]|nr:L-glutamate gamma-semialdehyde dehydrogenase [Flavobacteriaceae bacterium]PHX84497.1 MAG: 1-pyrroline-5-carboxylate dehydrogenase [Flavobacteriales bacterium]